MERYLENELEDELEATHEFEDELAHELGGAHEFEGENGEQFFKRAFRGVGRFIKRAAPMLKTIGRIAAPLVAKAVGGAFGGPAGAMLGAKLGQLAASQLREYEMELEAGMTHEAHAHEFEEELAHELGGAHEFEDELAHELGGAHEMQHEALAEVMAHFAAQSASESESEAMVGAATALTITARERRALRRMIPHLVRGASILTRILRLRRVTRPAVRVVPTIVRRTARVLARGAAAGRPVTRQRAARVMALQIRRVLGSPRYCGQVIDRNIRTARRLAPTLGRVSSRAAQIAARRRRY